MPAFLFLTAALPSLAFAAPEAGAPGLGIESVLQTLLALLLVLGAFIGVAWLMRRYGGVSPGVGGAALRIVGGVSVGQRERVVLLQAGDKQILVGVAPGRVQTLHVFDEPIIEPAGQGQGDSPGFAERLAQAMGRGARK